MGFPDTADLGTRVELQLGGTWTDITPSTRVAKTITVSRGRADYASAVDPSKVSLQIQNGDGAFSQYNPTGPYYGLLSRNTPLRVSVAAGSCFLNQPESASGIDRRISTPSTSALNVTGDVDLRWDVEVVDWDTPNTVELGGKWGTAGQQAWHAYIFSGTLRIGWTTDGTTENTAAAPLSNLVHPRRMCLRITMDVNNGAGGRTVQFFTGPTMTGPWTQIGGDNIVAGTTATATSTAPVEMGDVSTTNFVHAQARIYRAQIRNGINGTIVAAPDLTAATIAAGTPSFTDTAGVPWTANLSDAITNRVVRGTAEVPAWPSKWGPSGKLVTVDLDAAGILRRLGKGASPLDSPLRRSVAAARPLAYWPLEDGSAATQAASGLVGGSPMQIRHGTPQFGATDGPAGSLTLPDFTNGGTLYSTISGGSASSWTVDCIAKFPTVLPQGFVAALGWTASGSKANVWEIDAFPAGSGGLAIQWADFAFANLGGPYNSNVTITDGKWHHIRVTVAQSGTSITIRAWIDNNLVINATEASITLGGLRDITVNPYSSVDTGVPSMGHVAVWSPSTNVVTVPAVTGYDGETADARMVRLASEEGVPLLTPYGPGGDALLGPQGTDTLLNLLQGAVDADVGVLYEPRDTISLAARPRTSLYNQTPALILDYDQQQVAPPLEPVDDDQATRNDITRSRPNGSSARVTLDSGPMSTAQPPAGVGRYQDAQTVNVHTDDQLPQIAGWLLHLGTVDGVRYPQVTIFLHRNPELIDAARAVDIGDRIQILNLPPWLPPGIADLIVQGMSETIGVRTWKITFTCTPGAPWTVGVLDSAVLGKLATDGSVLAAAVSSTATLLPVVVTAGPPWVTTANNPTEFPFDIRVGGEVMTVSGIGGSAADAFGRTVANGWGTSDSGQAWTASGGTASNFAVGSGAGTITVTSVNVSRWVVLPQVAADFDIAATVSTSALAAGASQYAGLTGRWVDANNGYVCRLEFTTAAAVALTIRKRVAGTETQLVGGTVAGLTHTAGGQFKVRFQAVGSTLQAKVWTGSTEPDWTFAVTDTSFTAAGSVGMRALTATGNTNTNPVVTWDNFQNILPQGFTVARSVNGVVKAQPAAASVQLANPLVLAL